MARLTVIATTKGAPSSSNLMPSETHQIEIETSPQSSKIIVAISSEILNNAARIGDDAYGGEIREYPNVVAFLKDWTDIKSE